METITASLYDARRVTVDNSVDLKESAEMHREIYRAIRSHNPAGAKHAMERHLSLARMAQATEPEADPQPEPTSEPEPALTPADCP